MTKTKRCKCGKFVAKSKTYCSRSCSGRFNGNPRTRGK